METAFSFYELFDEILPLDSNGGVIASTPNNLSNIRLGEWFNKIIIERRVMVYSGEHVASHDREEILFSSPVHLNNTLIGDISRLYGFR